MNIISILIQFFLLFLRLVLAILLDFCDWMDFSAFFFFGGHVGQYNRDAAITCWQGIVPCCWEHLGPAFQPKLPFLSVWRSNLTHENTLISPVVGANSMHCLVV